MSVKFVTKHLWLLISNFFWRGGGLMEGELWERLQCLLSMALFFLWNSSEYIFFLSLYFCILNATLIYILKLY